MKKMTINFQKASEHYNKLIKNMTKKLDVNEITLIDKPTAEQTRQLLVDFLEDHWGDYVEFSNW